MFKAQEKTFKIRSDKLLASLDMNKHDFQFNHLLTEIYCRLALEQISDC
jgi:hypothetical protein